MRPAQLAGFFGIERGVNPTENYVGPALARQSPDFVAAQRIRGMNADAHGIAGLNPFRIHRAEGFIHQDGVAKLWGVAPASTYCQRGVITAVPNDTWLGLIR